MEKKTELLKALTITFAATSHLMKNSYFYTYKAGKNKYGSYWNLCNYFLHFKLLSEI